MTAQGPTTPSAQHHFTVQRDVSGYSMLSPLPAPQMMSPTKDINIVNMCRFGLEVVQDILSRAQDVFNLLCPKGMQLPNNVTFHGNQYTERKGKLGEQLQQITMNFKKLRVFYSKINETCDLTEIPNEQELIPYVGKELERTLPFSEAYYYVLDQHRDMVDSVKLKNQQLKEIIDSMRSIIWEINTMITMRKT